MAQNDNALFLPFIDGLLAGKTDSSVIIDGNEHSYYYRTAEDYEQSRSYLHGIGQQLLPRNPKVKDIKIAQSLYFDGIYLLFPYTKDKSLAEKNAFFSNAIKNAIANTDEYVWIYSERLNWWQPAENAELVKFMQQEIIKNKQAGQ